MITIDDSQARRIQAHRERMRQYSRASHNAQLKREHLPTQSPILEANLPHDVWVRDYRSGGHWRIVATGRNRAEAEALQRQVSMQGTFADAFGLTSFKVFPRGYEVDEVGEPRLGLPEMTSQVASPDIASHLGPHLGNPMGTPRPAADVRTPPALPDPGQHAYSRKERQDYSRTETVDLGPVAGITGGVRAFLVCKR